MPFSEIAIDELSFNPFTKIGSEWMLVCAGDEEKANAMTASWGGVGVWWNMPSATCYVRQTRYTKELIDSHDAFSIAFLDEEHRPALKLCGTESGRDGDKLAKAGLSVEMVDGTPVIAQARLAFVCRKQYAALMPPEGFVNPQAHENWYSKGELADNYHTMYIGSIERVLVAR